MTLTQHRQAVHGSHWMGEDLDALSEVVRAFFEREVIPHKERFAKHGPLNLIKHLLPDMRLRERGEIVVISSVTTGQAPSNSAPYTMAKESA